MFALNTSFFKTDETDTLYQFRLDQKKYPLDQILNAAETVGKGQTYFKS
jgi:hypothetical protein